MTFEMLYQSHRPRLHHQFARFDDASFRREMLERFARHDEADEAWLVSALADDQRKWFAAAVLEAAGGPPRRFVPAMVRAAVHERDPSLNRIFVDPVTRRYGHRVVIEALLRYLEDGTNQEKAGAARALYWSWPALCWPPNTTTSLENATPESRAAVEALDELRARVRVAKLREFVTNEDLEVRRCIIPGLELSPKSYPPEYADLVREAIRIGQGHPDEYVRHRTGVQLGSGGPFMALPRTPSGEK